MRQSTANTLAVADGVREELDELKSSLPPGTVAEVAYDESQFIRASIDGVLHTLLEGVALVILVILLFLRDWRSTIVAMVAIPVSIIAAFMVMSFFGASINVLTLLAIVLAIGIVVDDAIVEIENVHRRIEEGQPPLLASFDGAREIGFAVIATTATLMAVFVPLAFMTGNTGKLFREFGITLAASIFFSGVVARTLTPMLCSKLMVPAHGRIQRMTEPVFERMNSGYRWLLSRALRVPVVILVHRLPGVALGLWPVPVPAEGIRPDEDRGAIIVRIQAPEGASLDYTRDRVKEVERALMPLQEQGIVASMLSQVAPGFARPSPVNEGIVIVRLVPWEERTESQQDIVRQMTPKVSSLPRRARRRWSTRRPSAAPAASASRSSSCSAVPTTTRSAAGATSSCRRPRRRASSSTWTPTTASRSRTSASRSTAQRAADLGVSVEDIGRTLELMFGETEVSTFVSRGDEYPVIMRARAQDRATPNDLTNTFIRAAQRRARAALLLRDPDGIGSAPGAEPLRPPALDHDPVVA